MSDAVVELGGVVAGVIANFALMAFFYGRLTQTVKGHDNRLKDHDEKFDEQGKLIRDQGTDIAHLKGWKEGYEAAQKGSPNS